MTAALSCCAAVLQESIAGIAWVAELLWACSVCPMASCCLAQPQQQQLHTHVQSSLLQQCQLQMPMRPCALPLRLPHAQRISARRHQQPVSSVLVGNCRLTAQHMCTRGGDGVTQGCMRLGYSEGRGQCFFLWRHCFSATASFAGKEGTLGFGSYPCNAHQ